MLKAMGKTERWYGVLKREWLRPKVPLSPNEGRRIVTDLVEEVFLKRFILMEFWRFIRASHFMQSVAVLGMGTLLAQIITAGASPILTRLYLPEDFGLIALFSALVGSLSPSISGTYDVAIVVTKSNEESKQLLGIAIFLCFLMSLVVFTGLWLFSDQVLILLNAERLGDWVPLIPLALFLTGVVTSLNYYSNRFQEYHIIARSKIIYSFFGVVCSISFGLIGLHYGLVLSNVLATTATAMWLVFRYRAVLSPSLLRWNGSKSVLIRKYQDFPIFSASTGILDGLTLALPVFILSRHFHEAIVGYYALIMRVAIAPIGFISVAVSQVNLRKVADLVNRGQPVRPYLYRVTMMLVAILSPLLMIVLFYAPALFAWIFGEQWRIAGTYMRILMPALAVQFVASTLSTTFWATGHNRLCALWKVLAFVGTLTIFMTAAPRVDVIGMFKVMLVTNFVLYSAYYFMAWYAAGHTKRN